MSSNIFADEPPFVTHLSVRQLKAGGLPVTVVAIFARKYIAFSKVFSNFVAF